MPSKRTSNYQLSQWVKSDRVLMEDFNADNAKIDAALAKKAEQSALLSLETTVSTKADKSVLSALETTVSKKADKTALDALSKTVTSHATALDGKGNCRIYTTSYTGDGTNGTNHRKSITFPAKPAVVFIGERTGGATLVTTYGQARVYAHDSGYHLNLVTWSENTMSWYSDMSATTQLNQQGAVYDVVALIDAEK